MKKQFIALLFVSVFCLVVQAGTGEITINGDTPWVVMAEDYAEPAIQAAIRDCRARLVQGVRLSSGDIQE